MEVKDTYKERPNIYIFNGRTNCVHYHKTDCKRAMYVKGLSV